MNAHVGKVNLPVLALFVFLNLVQRPVSLEGPLCVRLDTLTGNIPVKELQYFFPWFYSKML